MIEVLKDNDVLMIFAPYTLPLTRTKGSASKVGLEYRTGKVEDTSLSLISKMFPFLIYTQTLTACTPDTGVSCYTYFNFVYIHGPSVVFHHP